MPPFEIGPQQATMLTPNIMVSGADRRPLHLGFGRTLRTSAAISIRRVPRLSRNVGQPDHILANPITSHKAERRPGSGEIWLAVTKHDGV